MENFAELWNGSYACPQNQYISQTHKLPRPMLKKSSNSLYYHDLELRLKSPVEIRKPSSLEESDGPQPEPKERTMTVLKLTEGGLDWLKGAWYQGVWGHWQEQASGSSIWTRNYEMLAWYEEILKEKKRSLSRQTSVPDFFSHLQSLVHRHMYCWT